MGHLLVVERISFTWPIAGLAKRTIPVREGLRPHAIEGLSAPGSGRPDVTSSRHEFLAAGYLYLTSIGIGS